MWIFDHDLILFLIHLSDYDCLFIFYMYTVDTVLISFTAKSLQLVLREKDAKSAEIKLVAKESELELENVLCYPPMCTLFEEFMISEHAPENLFFIR